MSWAASPVCHLRARRTRFQPERCQGQMSPARAEGATQQGRNGISFPLSSPLFFIHCLVATLFLFLRLFLLLILTPREVDEDVLWIEEPSDDEELWVDEAGKDGGKEGEGEEEENGRDDGAIGEREVERDGRTVRR